MNWFLRLFKEPEPVVIYREAPSEPPKVKYPGSEYTAYFEAIPNWDDTYLVRFYDRKTSRILEEHTIIGEWAVQQLAEQHMPKYKKVS